jgi:hypothetical protein
MAFATLSWTAHALGDTPTAHRAAGQAEERLSVLSGLERIRVGLVLARGSLAGRDTEGVQARLRGLEDALAAWPLLDWQARCLASASSGVPGPEPGALVEGLSPEDVKGLVGWS